MGMKKEGRCGKRTKREKSYWGETEKRRRVKKKGKMKWDGRKKIDVKKNQKKKIICWERRENIKKKKKKVKQEVV